MTKTPVEQAKLYVCSRLIEDIAFDDSGAPIWCYSGQPVMWETEGREICFLAEQKLLSALDQQVRYLRLLMTQTSDRPIPTLVRDIWGLLQIPWEQKLNTLTKVL